MVQLDDPLDDRHAQPGAAARGARLIADNERLEQRIRDGGRDADAVVRDRQEKRVRRFAQRKKQGGPARVILERVAGQVFKQAAQQPRVCLTGDRVVGQVGLQRKACVFQLGVFARKVALDQLAQVDLLRLERVIRVVEPRIGEQRIHQLGARGRLAANGLQIALLLIFRHNAVRQRLRIALDNGQRGFEVVRKVGDHALLLLVGVLLFDARLFKLVEQTGEAVGHILEFEREPVRLNLDPASLRVGDNRLVQRADRAADRAAEQQRQQEDGEQQHRHGQQPQPVCVVQCVQIGFAGQQGRDKYQRAGFAACGGVFIFYDIPLAAVDALEQLELPLGQPVNTREQIPFADGIIRIYNAVVDEFRHAGIFAVIVKGNIVSGVSRLVDHLGHGIVQVPVCGIDHPEVFRADIFLELIVRGVQQLVVPVEHEKGAALQPAVGDGGKVVLCERILVLQQGVDRREGAVEPRGDQRVGQRVDQEHQQRAQHEVGDAGAQEAPAGEQFIGFQFYTPTP